jgi:RNA polymerase sigma-54 factor
MALSASLFLRQSQSLVMTPQLMQSIRLLQMTHLELVQFIEQEVERNPLLELVAEDDGVRSADRDDGIMSMGDGPLMASDADVSQATGSLEGDWFESDMTGHAERLNDALDSNFDGDYPDNTATGGGDFPELMRQQKSVPSSMEAGSGFDLEDFASNQITLFDHIAQQIPFVIKSMSHRSIAQFLATHLDETGYIQIDLHDVAHRLGKPLADVTHVLELLQTLEPPGVFARSLSECLAIQLKQKNRLDPAMQVLIENLNLLARRDFASLKKLCRVDEEDLLDMLSEIRALDPKPGSRYLPVYQETIIPDIVLRSARDGTWQVELNPDTLPKVLINREYFAIVSGKTAKSSLDHAFLSECMQTANWLTRSLDQRAKTILKVAVEIVRQQEAFFAHGVDHLRPLNLKTVAEAIKMHESTVSRVTANKYMMTPRGLFELKYFFTVSIGSSDGAEDAHSAESVRQRIKTMIQMETAETVLSDDDIVAQLKSGGIDLARRTVAKYRESMNIASSVQRRREKRAMAKVMTA